MSTRFTWIAIILVHNVQRKWKKSKTYLANKKSKTYLLATILQDWQNMLKNWIGEINLFEKRTMQFSTGKRPNPVLRTKHKASKNDMVPVLMVICWFLYSLSRLFSFSFTYFLFSFIIALILTRFVCYTFYLHWACCRF